MRFTISITAVLLIWGLFFPRSSLLASESKSFVIPRVENIVLDGKSDDWKGQGLEISHLRDPEGQTLPDSDFDACFKTGWNEEGLLVTAVVQDDYPVEHSVPTRLWKYDCVEIFVAESLGSQNRYQLVVASGADKKYGTARAKLYDHRDEKYKTSGLRAPEFASSFTGGNYVIEAMMPWENIGLIPKPGSEFALQLIANDYDAGKGDGGPLRAAWFPSTDSHCDPNMMQRVVLGTGTGKSVEVK